MNKLQSIFRRLFQEGDAESFFGEANKRKYNRISFVLFIAMISIALGPVTIIAILSYQNYLNLLQAEERDQMQWRLESSIISMDSMITSIRKEVEFAAETSRYEELLVDENLTELFYLIKRQFPFVTDLGVIDQKGVQQTYSGPYDLKGQVYFEESWFDTVFSQSPHISSVYQGVRGVPHFAIAVSSIDPKNGDIWILRATIDATTLQRFVHTIKSSTSEDLFLIDKNGILQTDSKTFGQMLNPIDKASLRDNTANISIDGKNHFHALGAIDGTPWSLVLVEKRYIHHEKWEAFKSRLFLIFSACLIMSVMVVYWLVKTFRKKLQETDEIQMNMFKEAEHTNKLASVGRLAAGVGHEINNPLAIINQKNGLAEDLLEISQDFEHKETIKGCLKSINQSIERCKAITHRLLGFARRTDVVMESLQLNDIIKEVLSFLDNSVIHNKIRMELRLEEDLPRVSGDRMQLQQVFLNIINNAIDAIGKNGNISILTCRLANETQVIIQDSGPGISEKNLAHIFEPFFTTKETGKGTGLGLSITYGLVKEMRGDITVKSQYGKGTAFTITLPISEEQ